MKNTQFKTYIYWGVTAVAVIAAGLLLTLLMFNLDMVKSSFVRIAGILAPIIYGAVLAYLLAPLYNRTVNAWEKIFKKLSHNEKRVHNMSKSMATIVSLLTLIVIVTALFWMLIPQLIESITGVIEVLPANINNFSVWLEKILKDNPAVEQTVMANYEQIVQKISGFVTTDLVPNVNKLITSLSSGVIGVVVVLKNILIGLIVMLYLLNIKDTLVAQGKKILYGCLSVRMANRVVDKLRYTQSVFSGFIIGKLMDSLIIGIMSFILLTVMNMPYVLLVSVIIGVTNIIPFFGPFIGAIPTAFLILLVSPVKCLYFIGFILILQQVDGNIIGPKILGDSTGLSSFWVLFSILLFGGLFGFVGMIIAVPTFAVLYALLSETVSHFLNKRQLSTNTDDYRGLMRIDEETCEYVQAESQTAEEKTNTKDEV